MLKYELIKCYVQFQTVFGELNENDEYDDDDEVNEIWCLYSPGMLL